MAQRTAELPRVPSMAEFQDVHIVLQWQRRWHRELWKYAGAFDGRVEDNLGDMQQYCKALGGGSLSLSAYVMAVVLAGGGKNFPTVPIVFPIAVPWFSLRLPFSSSRFGKSRKYRRRLEANVEAQKNCGNAAAASVVPAR